MPPGTEPGRLPPGMAMFVAGDIAEMTPMPACRDSATDEAGTPYDDADGMGAAAIVFPDSNCDSCWWFCMSNIWVGCKLSPPLLLPLMPF